MGSIVLDGVRKSFGPAEIIKGVNLEIADKSFVVFVGPSGCGKSTLLRLIAGLEDMTGGKILIDGVDVSGLPPAKRGLSMVFQSYALYPHMSVRSNIGFGLKMSGMPRDQIAQRVEAAAAKLNLTPYLDRRPGQLSGGQRQRVAIARAIVLNPRLLVADEPVSMLDVSVRAGILRLLKRLVVEQQMAMVFITHDLSIVTHICDALAVMYRGRIVEQGPARDVLRTPVHPYTQALIDAVPIPNPGVEPRVLPAKLFEGAGEAPSRQGCRFAPRCIHALPDCTTEDPASISVGPSHAAACLRAKELRNTHP
jgi:multiple sugar transport system ATP-binding protein